MESKRYKGKGLGKDEQEIEELPIKIFDSNEDKSGLGTKMKNPKIQFPIIVMMSPK